MNYFAYGSNMSLSRLGARCPSAVRLGTYYLVGHQLRYHKASADGSGKCDAFYTGESSHVIYGALFDLSEQDKVTLDKIEGLGQGYNQKRVDVINDEGELVQAITYYATDINTELKPYSWYLNHVIIGANESELPESYRMKIQNTLSIEDMNLQRASLENSVHKGPR